MSKHFLYLTNDKLIALVWRNNAIVSRDVFSPSDADSPEFTQYLLTLSGVPTYFLLDLIEEDFRLDTVPHLSGADSEAVLARKMGQIYRATSFRNAIVQGREPEGRRDDKVFYHAITNGDLVKPWLAAFEKAKLPLEGIFSSPVLSANLLERANIIQPHTLLVTIVPDFGLRQTYFQEGKIKFSRLTPIVYDQGKSVGNLIAAEIGRTLQYLDGLRFFSSEETLEAVIVVHQRDQKMIAEAIGSFPVLRHRFLDITDLARKTGFVTVPASSHAEEILVHIFAKGRITNHFADSQSKRFSVLRRVRIGLAAVTVVLLMAALGWSGFSLYDANKIAADTRRVEANNNNLQNELKSIALVLSLQKTASDSVRDTRLFFNSHIRPQPPAPGDFFRSMSDVITAFPKVRLLQISWANSADAQSTPAYQAMQGTKNVSLTSVDPKTAGPGGGQVKDAALSRDGIGKDYVFPGNRVQVAAVELAFTGFDGNYRQLLDDIEALRKQFETQGGFKASALLLPLNTSPDASLRKVDLAGVESDELRFVFKLVKEVAKS